MDHANKAQRKLGGEKFLGVLKAQAQVPYGQVRCVSETWIPPPKTRHFFQLSVA